MPRSRTPVDRRPLVFRTLRREARSVRSSPTGDVGDLFRGSGLELVWVRKEGEEIDPGWFVSPQVDLLIVVQGRLRVEFADPTAPIAVLGPGDVLVLPPRTKCRAYRWPRRSRRATVFVAAYPTGRRHRHASGVG